jgi:hypothetical protein
MDERQQAYLERYLSTEIGQEAGRRAMQRQAEKRQAERAERRIKINEFRLTLVGLRREEQSAAMRQFKMGLDRQELEARIEKERGRAEKRDARQQARRGSLRSAEVRRVERLMETGFIDAMPVAERQRWLAECQRLNPIMYEVLKEKGVT